MELQAILRRRVTVADARWLPSGHGIGPYQAENQGGTFLKYYVGNVFNRYCLGIDWHRDLTKSVVRAD